MKVKKMYVVLFVLLIAIVIFSFISQPDIKFVIPKGWPKPVYNFRKNKITKAGFNLGRTLFFDPVLSKDSSISCVSCHLQFSGFTHGDHSLSHGINGIKGIRNSSTLFNLAWSPSFMWDGGVNRLEMQPLNPITNPVEMGSDLKDVLSKLNNSVRYRKLFYRAYQDSLITTKNLLRSLTQFTVMFQSYNAKYDKVKRKEMNITFSLDEQNGYKLFKQHCDGCHTEPLFTNYTFQNNGLPVDTELNDYGRMRITQSAFDSLKFKVPSLRNVFVSGPYMHDGRFRSLDQVLDHYTNGVQYNATLALQLKEKISLTKKERLELICFLNSLTDKEFLSDIKFRNYLND
ncbi:MAG: cytochrome-c peroxidase [Bacteroidia bacterium]|nr:cytochrome-c peroxidase [Bacteroidia bacterium]